MFTIKPNSKSYYHNSFFNNIAAFLHFYDSVIISTHAVTEYLKGGTFTVRTPVAVVKFGTRVYTQISLLQQDNIQTSYYTTTCPASTAQVYTGGLYMVHAHTPKKKIKKSNPTRSVNI